MSAVATVKPFLSPRWTTFGRCLLRGLPIPRWGNMRRTTPFSACYGFDRGTPVDRYYVGRFLEEHAADIHGNVLEIQMSAYTRRFGRHVLRADTVDINPEHGATYTCDLSASDAIIPSDLYDCFLLPNTLSFLRHLEPCLRHALRVVKPGGVILATTAVIGQVESDGDYWRLSAAGWREVASRIWSGCDLTVVAYGNALAATAAVHGLTVEELTSAELDAHDPRFPVLVALRCQRR